MVRIINFLVNRSQCFRSRKPGMKSISRARASFAAVLNVKLTSCRSTFVMYGFDTFMRFASSLWFTPSSFIRRRMWRRNTEPMWSIALISHRTSKGQTYCNISRESSAVPPGQPAAIVELRMKGECAEFHLRSSHSLKNGFSNRYSPAYSNINSSATSRRIALVTLPTFLMP